MNREFKEFLAYWKHPVLTSADLAAVLEGTPVQRHSLVKRLMKKDTLIQLKRGVYLVGWPYVQSRPDPFVIAQLLYGPSYISFESALAYYGWIPEAVYTTTCATTKKHKEYFTEVGRFVFEHTPVQNFMLGVHHRQEDLSSFLIADPWKAVADLCYYQRKKWKSLSELKEDMRVEEDHLRQSDLPLLLELTHYYSSVRVRHVLKRFYEELSKWK